MNLIEILRARAARQADKTAYRFLANGEDEEASVTYAELDRRARALGAFLQEHGGAGERVLLLYPPGLEFIAAIFGGLGSYPGAVVGGLVVGVVEAIATGYVSSEFKDAVTFGALLLLLLVRPHGIFGHAR